jgi:two-component system NtrC family sensor kinase
LLQLLEWQGISPLRLGTHVEFLYDVRTLIRSIQTLRFRVLVGSFLLLLALFGIYSYLTVRFHSDQMMDQVIESANRVSDVIKKSMHYSMMLNRKEDTYQIIATIGEEPGVEGIRIYNKSGEIIFSTDKSEERSVVNLRAEACYACHDQAKPLESLSTANRTRIYEGARGTRVLGLINPIRNEAGCSDGGCHAHPPDKTILGVLDVRMSLESVDHAIAHSRATMLTYAFGAIAVITLVSMMFLWMTVLKPVEHLTEGTRQLSAGNLQYRIPESDSHDELGQLARAFNAMASSLHTAQDENERWAQTLEQRVEQKTNELKAIHAQILHIEKMASLGKLSATVAHELNNPLEAIVTYAKLIARRFERSDTLSDTMKTSLEDVRLVAREADRCGTIVKNLLLFSRKQVGEFTIVPVRQIVEQATRLVQHHLQISNVTLRTEFPPETDASILCDESQIRQALLALFVNAVEAMPDGGTLTVGITVDTSTEEVRVSITDTGIGIPEDDLPHVFEPFFTTKKEGKGVGLGLSVVYGIVERHSAHIAIRSECGRGTTIVLAFPPAHRAGAAQRTSLPSTADKS